MEKEKYFVQKMNGIILFSHATAEAQIRTLRKYYPEEGYRVFPSIYENKSNHFAYVWEHLERLGAHVLKKLENNPEFMHHMLAVWKEKAKDLDDFIGELKNSDFSKFSDKHLLDSFYKLIHLYQEEFGYPMLCDAFGVHTEKILVEKLKKHDQKNFAKHISVLISPVYDSFMTRESKSFLELIVEIESHQETKEKIKSGKFDFQNPKIKEILSVHVDNFFWITNGYHQGIRLSEKYFLEQIQEFFKENLNASKRLSELKTQNELNKKAKKEFLERISADKSLIDLIGWIEYFTLMHDERKCYVLKVTYYLNEMLKEVSKRKNIGMDDLHAHFYFEIKDIFEGKFNLEEIEKRKKLCYYVISDTEFYYATGPEAEKWKKEILGEVKKENVFEFRGTPASLGVAAGKVKVITSSNEFSKLEKGDVLVTGMTRPEYVVIMKKAAAIITDEGGITCHAAIISRELGIPCVIGTHKATKILKDNMLVEVNGNHGIIRVLEKDGKKLK